MKLKVNSCLQYNVLSSGTIILNIHALQTNQQHILEEKLIINPFIENEELPGALGEKRLIRFDVEKDSELKIEYSATVESTVLFTDHQQQTESAVSQLPNDVLPYLNPSRYCQSDKLSRFANNHFGEIANPFEKVLAVKNWIHENVEYLSGSTDSETSAFDTVTELAGVCRDFAHLGITLCRALSIPARYFTGYAYQLEPQDFHACFEAFIGGHWILFDATELVPLNGLVKISTGMDAADSSVASIFGNVQFVSSEVSCECLGDDCEPFHYEDGLCKGISYG